jgi:hypothetical protein
LQNSGQASKKSLSTYPDGMKQRPGIERALLANPKLIVVDEPTAGLDSGRAQLFPRPVELDRVQLHGDPTPSHRGEPTRAVSANGDHLERGAFEEPLFPKLAMPRCPRDPLDRIRSQSMRQLTIYGASSTPCYQVPAIRSINMTAELKKSRPENCDRRTRRVA